MNVMEILRQMESDANKEDPVDSVVDQTTFPFDCAECDKFDTDPIIGIHWCYDMKTYHNLLHLKSCPKEPPF